MELKRLLKHIADAIREKTGVSDTIVAADFPANISAIPIKPKGMHAITLSASDPAGGTVSGGGLALEGMTVTVKAEASEGYRFAGWYKGSAHQLPPGYTELEYIRSNGAQYIDTGFTPNQDTRVTARCECPSSVEDTVAHHMFSSYEALTKRSYACYYYRGNFCSGYGTEDKVIRRDLIAGMFEADKNKNIFTLDGMVFTHGAASFTCPGPLYLFAANNNGNASRHSAMTLYSCQIYDNGTLIRSYVPCAAPDGAVGLYDIVNGSFYGNEGGGTFEAGPEAVVSEDVEYTFTVSGDQKLTAMFEPAL